VQQKLVVELVDANRLVRGSRCCPSSSAPSCGYHDRGGEQSRDGTERLESRKTQGRTYARCCAKRPLLAVLGRHWATMALLLDLPMHAHDAPPKSSRMQSLRHGRLRLLHCWCEQLKRSLTSRGEVKLSDIVSTSSRRPSRTAPIEIHLDNAVVVSCDNQHGGLGIGAMECCDGNGQEV